MVDPEETAPGASETPTNDETASDEHSPAPIMTHEEGDGDAGQDKSKPG